MAKRRNHKAEYRRRALLARQRVRKLLAGASLTSPSTSGRRLCRPARRRPRVAHTSGWGCSIGLAGSTQRSRRLLASSESRWRRSATGSRMPSSRRSREGPCLGARTGSPAFARCSSRARKVLRGDTRPHPKRRVMYEAVAVAFAAKQLGERAATVAQVLPRYLETRGRVAESERLCEQCGKPIPPERRADARYCSDRCRKAANRAGLKKAARSGAPARRLGRSRARPNRPDLGVIAS
jgi:hypothetical protein